MTKIFLILYALGIFVVSAIQAAYIAILIYKTLAGLPMETQEGPIKDFLKSLFIFSWSWPILLVIGLIMIISWMIITLIFVFEDLVQSLSVRIKDSFHKEKA